MCCYAAPVRAGFLVGVAGLASLVASGCGDDTSVGAGESSTGLGEGSTGPGATTVGASATNTATTNSTTVTPGTESDSGVADSTGVVDSTDTTAAESSSSTATDSSSGTNSSTGSTGSTGGVGNGECTAHSECGTGYCREFTDVPPDEMSLCDVAPAGGATRFTGTVRDIATLDVVADAEVRVSGVLQVFTNPVGAAAIVSATSDASGEIDVTSSEPVQASIGVAALTELPNYFLSSTALAAPDVNGIYPPGNVLHDVFVVSVDTVELWSDLLATDVAIPDELLPLGDAGGSVFIVRDAISGDAVAGATAVPLDGGTSALVRYPSTDGTTLGTETDDNGIVLVLDPALSESFLIDTGAGSVTLTIGTADNLIFTVQVAAE